MIRTYQLLEKDTNDLGSIIHFDEKNLDAFGIRIYTLIFLSCNLFESAAKEITQKNESDMSDWKSHPKIRQYSKFEMTFIPMGFKFKPLEELGYSDEKKRKLIWWQEYNNTKHELSSQINKATLRNLIYALGSTGLLVSDVANNNIRGISNQSILFDGLYFPRTKYVVY